MLINIDEYFQVKLGLVLAEGSPFQLQNAAGLGLAGRRLQIGKFLFCPSKATIFCTWA